MCSRIRRGRPTGRRPTSGSSSSATRCSSSRSRRRCTTGSRRHPTAAWRRSGPMSSRATAAPASRRSSTSGASSSSRPRTCPSAELDRISHSRNVLAALLEAAIAAVYLEHGFEVAEQAVVEAFDARIEFAPHRHRRQEDRAPGGARPLAATRSSTRSSTSKGPPHDRRFVCVAVIAGEQVGIGKASTKKAAEQEAARQALESLGDRPGERRLRLSPAFPTSAAPAGSG